MNAVKRFKFYNNLIIKSGVLENNTFNFSILKRTLTNYVNIYKRKSLSALDINNVKKFNNNQVTCFNNLDHASKAYSAAATPNSDGAPPLNKENAHSLVMRLTTEERNALMTVLQEFESEQLKAQYKGQLAAFRWRSKFGRPSKLPSLGDVDPTGSYCPVPEDWLLRKYAETVPKPTTNQLLQVAFHNATPFVGFGFLDNFFMIICGDYIELYLGSIITISTMAAAALGNTLSDILGIGSAFYVERAVLKVGFKPPNLSPIQLDMVSSRVASNGGRVFGVTVGCLLGMFPLLLFKKDKSASELKAANKDPVSPEISSGQHGTSISVA